MTLAVLLRRGCQHLKYSELYRRHILVFEDEAWTDERIARFRFCPYCGKRRPEPIYMGSRA